MLKKFAKKIFVLLSILSPMFSKKSNMSYETARKTLTEFLPKASGTPIRENTLCSQCCDLQIIVPAYNVEKYLEECLDSILFQKTKYSYKVVIVDDGSTDETGKIADKYSNDERVIVIHQENKGFSGARNTALEKIFSKYIMFVDSDDMLCPGAIESLLNTAFKYESDIVEGGAFSLKGEKKEKFFYYPKEKEVPSALGLLHGMPWAKVFKSDCFKNIIYPEGFWFEDSIFSFLIYPIKQRISVIDKFAYIYRQNNNGITLTQKGKPKSLDTYWITEMLMDTRSKLDMPFDESFFEFFLRQVVLNQHRIAKLPEHIQESVFVLTAETMNNYFSSDLIKTKKHLKLVEALNSKDFGVYKFYCKCKI